ncbi:hypothetical protein C8R47DRAFT_1250866 [Mycena vitilis]|nr:hypothetical protein C8R47DRAFT_1250866 [Mycena vitilis]
MIRGSLFRVASIASQPNTRLSSSPSSFFVSRPPTPGCSGFPPHGALPSTASREWARFPGQTRRPARFPCASPPAESAAKRPIPPQTQPIHTSTHLTHRAVEDRSTSILSLTGGRSKSPLSYDNLKPFVPHVEVISDQTVSQASLVPDVVGHRSLLSRAESIRGYGSHNKGDFDRPPVRLRIEVERSSTALCVSNDSLGQNGLEASPINKKTQGGPSPKFHDHFGLHAGEEELEGAADAVRVAKYMIERCREEGGGGYLKEKILSEWNPDPFLPEREQRCERRRRVVDFEVIPERPHRAQISVGVIVEYLREDAVCAEDGCCLGPDDVEGEDIVSVTDGERDAGLAAAQKARAVTFARLLGCCSKESLEYLRLEVRADANCSESLLHREAERRGPEKDPSVRGYVRAERARRDLVTGAWGVRLLWGQRVGCDLARVENDVARGEASRVRGVSYDARVRGGIERKTRRERRIDEYWAETRWTRRGKAIDHVLVPDVVGQYRSLRSRAESIRGYGSSFMSHSAAKTVPTAFFVQQDGHQGDSLISGSP